MKTHTWFRGEHIRVAGFQMSFRVGAALGRYARDGQFPRLAAYQARMVARPAYQRGIAKGGPVVMS